jgi:hypothetical protein
MSSFVRFGALAGALGVTLFTASAATSRRSLQDHDVVIDKELLITAVEVVDSPLATYPGPWSFGHLMDEAYGAEKAPAMVAQWLESWAEGKLPGNSGVSIEGREGLRKLLIEPWQKADGYQPGEKEGEDEGWLPNLANAPFQLLAIVNRMDLSVPLASFNDPKSIPLPAGPAYYGSPGGFDSAGGEGRLVFAATDQEGNPLSPGVTLILEYGLDIAREQDRFLDWAMAWHELGLHESHDATYRASLAKVTRAFTDRREVNDTKNPDRPVFKPEQLRKLSLIDRLTSMTTNMPIQLMRIRTNDGAFGKVREFREFRWTARGFDAAPLAGTPREIFFRKGTMENRWMARWLRVQGTEKVTATTARDDPQNEIPNSFVLPSSVRVRGKMEPVVAHIAPVPGNSAAYHWDGWGTRRQGLRRAFSTQTCCGCHCGDTNTEFFHIGPRIRGEETKLSKFLRTDGTRWRAVDPKTRRSFLSAEMELRKELFEAALKPDLRSRKIKALKESRQEAAD